MSLSTALFAFQTIGGNIGIPLILLTILLSKRVHRNPLFLNFLVLFIIYSISLNLLLYASQVPSGLSSQVRSYGLCLFQASMVNAISVVTPLSGLILIIDAWMTTCKIDKNEKSYTMRISGSTYALIGLCWVAFISLTVFLCIAGSHESVNINDVNMACTINSPLILFVPFLAGFFTVGIIIFEGLALYEIFRRGWSISAIKSKAYSPAATIARTGVFSLYAAFSLVAAIGFGINTHSVFPHVIQSSLPFAAFIVFGARKDILTVWGVIPLWKRLRGVKDEPMERPSESVPPSWSRSLYPMGLDKTNFRLSSSSEGSDSVFHLPIQPIRSSVYYGPNNV